MRGRRLAWHGSLAAPGWLLPACLPTRVLEGGRFSWLPHAGLLGSTIYQLNASAVSNVARSLGSSGLWGGRATSGMASQKQGQLLEAWSRWCARVVRESWRAGRVVPCSAATRK